MLNWSWLRAGTSGPLSLSIEQHILMRMIIIVKQLIIGNVEYSHHSVIHQGQPQNKVPKVFHWKKLYLLLKLHGCLLVSGRSLLIDTRSYTSLLISPTSYRKPIPSLLHSPFKTYGIPHWPSRCWFGYQSWCGLSCLNLLIQCFRDDYCCYVDAIFLFLPHRV